MVCLATDIKKTHGEYKCKLCGNFFNSMSAMKRHEKKHLETKEHSCDICKKDFSRKEHLKNILSPAPQRI